MRPGRLIAIGALAAGLVAVPFGAFAAASSRTPALSTHGSMQSAHRHHGHRDHPPGYPPSPAVTGQTEVAVAGTVTSGGGGANFTITTAAPPLTGTSTTLPPLTGTAGTTPPLTGTSTTMLSGTPGSMSLTGTSTTTPPLTGTSTTTPPVSSTSWTIDVSSSTSYIEPGASSPSVAVGDVVIVVGSLTGTANTITASAVYLPPVLVTGTVSSGGAGAAFTITAAGPALAPLTSTAVTVNVSPSTLYREPGFGAPNVSPGDVVEVFGLQDGANAVLALQVVLFPAATSIVTTTGVTSIVTTTPSSSPPSLGTTPPTYPTTSSYQASGRSSPSPCAGSGSNSTSPSGFPGPSGKYSGSSGSGQQSTSLTSTYSSTSPQSSHSGASWQGGNGTWSNGAPNGGGHHQHDGR